MYAKFIRQEAGNGVLSSKGLSVCTPRTSVVYEADELTYSKRCFLSVAEYTEWNRTKTEAIHTTMIGNCPQQNDGPFEVIMATVWRNGGVVCTVHAPNCELYVLNSDGKTIDRLWCAEHSDQRDMLVEENAG